MRYAITLVAIEDDNAPAETIETEMAAGLWGELYPDDADPIAFTTRGATVVDAATLADVVGALRVGADGADAEVDAVADMLEAVTR